MLGGIGLISLSLTCQTFAVCINGSRFRDIPHKASTSTNDYYFLLAAEST